MSEIIKKDIVKFWYSYGLLERLPKIDKPLVAKLFEDTKDIMSIQIGKKSELEESFETVIFPIARRVFSEVKEDKYKIHKYKGKELRKILESLTADFIVKAAKEIYEKIYLMYRDFFVGYYTIDFEAEACVMTSKLIYQKFTNYYINNGIQERTSR